MSASGQWLVVALLLAWSLGFTLRRFLPARLQQQAADWLRVQGWLRLAARVQPAPKAGCGSGCADCSPACASQTPVAAEQPVVWRQPPR